MQMVPGDPALVMAGAAAPADEVQRIREQFGLGQGKAGVSAVLYVQIASLIGVGIGGWLADRWMRRTERGRIFVSALGMLLFLPALFGVGNAGTLFVAICFLVLF